MSDSPIFSFDHSDEAMGEASKKARETFKYFWREVAWERHRIVAALDLASVKAAFRDDEPNEDGEHPVEHMWLAEVDFDGHAVSGLLLNAPRWLKSVKEGQPVDVPLSRIEDWMYVIEGRVYGAYTVNLMRSRMSRADRRAHDDAWGLDFGDPERIELVPPPKSKAHGFLSKLFGGKAPPEPADPDAEHPMSLNMAPSLRELEPSSITSVDDRGWTLLHHQALAGSAPGVEVLLELGADKNAVTNHGMTPLQLAESLGWKRVIELLS